MDGRTTSWLEQTALDEGRSVGDALRAGIDPGEERYAESWVICDSVKDDTVARSCKDRRAHSRFAVAYEMP